MIFIGSIPSHSIYMLGVMYILQSWLTSLFRFRLNEVKTGNLLQICHVNLKIQDSTVHLDWQMLVKKELRILYFTYFIIYNIANKDKERQNKHKFKANYEIVFFSHYFEIFELTFRT